MQVCVCVCAAREIKRGGACYTLYESDLAVCFTTVGAVVMIVFRCTVGWIFANLCILQPTKGVCALGVGVELVEGIYVHYISQVLSFCQVAVVVMTVYVCRVGVYANLYIFHLATMTCPAEINTNRGLALHKLPTERVVDKRESSDSQDQLGQIQQGI